jgi:uncharacterized protein YgiM (DUF1202 family)
MYTKYRASVFTSLLLGFLSSAALAAPGDIHRVSGAELVNLRAGPTDESNIRGTVEQGDEVIELTRDGNWIGVRVLQTGEEGWIYGGLLERVAQSGLLPADRGGSGGDAGFLQLSEDFDRLMRRVNGDLGYPLVEDAVPVAEGVLQVQPTDAWMRAVAGTPT